MKMNNGCDSDIKVEVVGTDVSPTVTIMPDKSFTKSTKSTYHYSDSVNPPLYMRTSISTAPYTPDNMLQHMNYVTSPSDYNTHHRDYQGSPPSIDKAPALVRRMNSKNGDLDNTSNSTAPPSPSTTPPEDKHVWSKAEVELLLDLYEQNKNQLKDPRVRKTKIWEDVAKQLRERLDSEVNGCQCNQKFRNLKADFQKVLEHNGRPGNFKRVCKYYDRLAHLLDYTLTATGYRSPRPAVYPTSEPTLPVVSDHADVSRHLVQRDFYYDNDHNASMANNKRKYIEHSPKHSHLNGLQNGHHEQYFSNKKAKTACCCDCNQEIHHLRESIERINNYVLARSAHEEERLRRLEDIHREKLMTMSRFLDIFKDYIHKMS